MKNLVLLVIVAAVGVVLAGLMGLVNVPGITPKSSSPSVEKLEPPKEDKPAEAPKPTAVEKPAEKPAPSSQATNMKPATPAKKFLPAIQQSDVDRAQALYMKADWAGVTRALDGCERDEIEDGPSTKAARALVRKARILDTLTKKFERNRLIMAKTLERVSLNSGGEPIGEVVDKGDHLTIYLIGNASSDVKTEDVAARTPVGKDALSDKLHARLKDKEAKIKADDCFGNMRLGHFCWQYAMDQEAVPYLDKAVEDNDFPVLARVFGGSSADKLVETWRLMKGIAPGSPDQANVSSAPAKGAAPPPPPSHSPPPPSGGKVPDIYLAQRTYNEGTMKYQNSFGDSPEAHASLREALALFRKARDILGDYEHPSIDDLRTSINKLLYDCSKRSSVQ
jgi:hypothetical protein